MTESIAVLAATVRQLDARRQIHDVLMRYSRGVDHRDEGLLAGCYHPGAVDDHGFYQGSSAGFIQAALEAGAGFENMRHVLCNEYVEFDADNVSLAYSETVVLACMTSRRDTGLQLGITACRFLDRFEERDGEWRIAHRKVVLDWDVVMPTTGAQGSAMTIGMLRGLPDPSDPSFGLGFQQWSNGPIPPISADRALG